MKMTKIKKQTNELIDYIKSFNGIPLNHPIRKRAKIAFYEKKLQEDNVIFLNDMLDTVESMVNEGIKHTYISKFIKKKKNNRTLKCLIKY